MLFYERTRKRSISGHDVLFCLNNSINRPVFVQLGALNTIKLSFNDTNFLLAELLCNLTAINNCELTCIVEWKFVNDVISLTSSGMVRDLLEGFCFVNNLLAVVAT